MDLVSCLRVALNKEGIISHIVFSEVNFNMFMSNEVYKNSIIHISFRRRLIFTLAKCH